MQMIIAGIGTILITGPPLARTMAPHICSDGRADRDAGHHQGIDADREERQVVEG